MAVALKPHANEHWLTLLNCYRCGKAPTESPIFKCGNGHTVCNGCYAREVKGLSMEVCPCCGSSILTRKEISMDLVHKLTTKPGIGRPRRYAPRSSVVNANNLLSPSMVTSSITALSDLQSPIARSRIIRPDTDFDYSDDTMITLEKLFQMPRDKVNELLDSDTMRRIKSKADCTQVLYELGKSPPDKTRSEAKIETSELGLLPKSFSSSMTLASKKPITCPITDCNKIVAQSSFQSHFKFDHSDLPRILSERGKDFIVLVDADVFSFNTSHCIGVATIYNHSTTFTIINASSCSANSSEASASSCNTVSVNTPRRHHGTSGYNGLNSSLPIGDSGISLPCHFWIMVSGSAHMRPENAYALFWVFSYRDEQTMCTMELSSRRDVFSSSIQCAVHGLQDSQDIRELSGSLNCLFVPYGALKTMLSCGTAVNLRVTIH